MSTIFAAFVDRAHEAPEGRFALFVRGGKERLLTNGWVLSVAELIVEQLASMSVQRGDVVAIVLEHSPYLYPAFVGCVLAGFIPTILPPQTPRQDPDIFARSMNVLFARIRPRAIITSKAVAGAVASSGISNLFTDYLDSVLEERALSGQPRADSSVFAVYDLAETSIAFLQHSSGTTGHKKGVMLNHAQVLAQVDVYARAIAAAPGDVIASWLPLYHDMGLITSFLLPAIIGCEIVSLDALEWVLRPGMLLDVIMREKAAYAWLPNFAFHHIRRANYDDASLNLRSLKMLVSCSEPCRMATFEQFSDRFSNAGVSMAKLKVSYAMAENVFAVTQTPFDCEPREGRLDHTRGYVSCGAVLPGVEVRIISPTRQCLPDGELGEIAIRSPFLFQGYFGQPEITVDRILDGWFYTRDLGCFEDGELFVVGRIDDLLIFNGKNLVAHELEDEVGTIPGLLPGRVLVFGDYDEALGAERMNVFAEHLEETLPSEAVKAQVRKAILSLCGVLPASIQFLPRGFLIKSTSGKIARAESIRKIRSGTR